MGDADQEIITRFTIENAEAIANARKIQVEIDNIKDRIHQMSVTSGQDLKVIVKGLREMYEAQEKAAGAKVKQAIGGLAKNELSGEVDTSKITQDQFNSLKQMVVEWKNAQVELAKFTKFSGDALRQLGVEYKQTGQIVKTVTQEEIAFQKQLSDALGVSYSSQVAAKKSADAQITASSKAKLAQEAQITKQDAEFNRQLTEHLNDSAQRQKRIDAEHTKYAEQQANKRAQALRKEAQEALKAQKSSGGLVGILKQLGGAMQIAFGLGTYQIIQSIVQGFQDLMQSGYDYAVSLFRLGAAINALQMKGMNVSIAQTIGLITELDNKFKVFTTKQLVGAVGEMYLLTRNFGLTNDQMQDMLEISAQLGIVLGKDVGETAKSLALFISSGYGETLQRAGISVNRLTVTMQAWSLGIKKSYMALTEEERALAAVTLVQKFKADLDKQSQEYYKTVPGQIDLATKAIKDQTDALSVQILPLKKVWNNFLLYLNAFVIEAINYFISYLTKQAIKITAVLVVPFLTAMQVMADFKNGLYDNASDIVKIYSRIFDEIKAGIEKNSQEMKLEPIDLSKLLGEDTGSTVVKTAKEMSDAFSTTIEEANQHILEIQQAANQEILDENANFAAESTKAYDEYWANLENLTAEYAQKILDLRSELESDIADITKDYQQDLEDLEHDTQDKLADAQRKYREAEWKAERDFQERMRKLREDFLLNLEDALRERDALQVLRLIRQYNLSKEQAEREYALEREERRRAYAEELADIRHQEADKRAELLRAYNQKIADMKAEAAKEELLLLMEEQQKRSDLIANYLAEKAIRDAQHAQEIADIKQHLLDEIGAYVASLVEGGKLTEAQAKGLAAIWATYLGKDGVIGLTIAEYQAVMDGAIAAATIQLALLADMLQDAVDFYNKIQAQLAASQAALDDFALRHPGYVPPPPLPPVPPPRAFGGSMYAASATPVVFGEAGPEIATFTPLTKMNTQGYGGLSPYRAGMGANGGGMGQAAVRIMLSPGLIAQIIDSTLDQQSKVFLDVINARE